MARRSVLLRAILSLLVIWAVVWSVRSAATSRQVTAERIEREIAAAEFDDWSERHRVPDAAEAARRERGIRRLAAMFNKLDFREREKSREERAGERFFAKLAPQEKALFLDLTVEETMKNFMQALDALPPEQRREFVERGLREIREGRTAEEMARADALADDLLDRIAEEGMKAYFENSTAETKLDLVPLMEAMNETMQGLRGNEFGLRR